MKCQSTVLGGARTFLQRVLLNSQFSAMAIHTKIVKPTLNNSLPIRLSVIRTLSTEKNVKSSSEDVIFTKISSATQTEEVKPMQPSWSWVPPRDAEASGDIADSTIPVIKK